jgi:hypothetical protein
MDYSSKKELWSYLVNFRCNISKPWCLVGDFNETISPSDRKGGINITCSMKAFQ